VGVTRLKNIGFTIVELAVIITVIGILAGLTVVGYGAWQKRTATNLVKTDLTSVAAALESARNFSNSYPSSFPASYQPSANVVMEMTVTTPGKYCINAYSTKDTSVRMSVYSDDGKNIREYLCTGATSGTVIGGTIPSTPTGVNIAPSLASWTLGGGATYNASTGELILGTTGTATSPKIRVNGVAGMNINGQFYAAIQSPNTGFQPNGGWLSGAAYYTSDGVSSATNTWGYTGNGCAGKVTLNSWNSSLTGDCGYALGNNVVYATVSLSGGSGYASPDIKIKDFTIKAY
jgi:Tfp pilus assembly protein PilE